MIRPERRARSPLRTGRSGRSGKPETAGDPGRSPISAGEMLLLMKPSAAKMEPGMFVLYKFN